MENEQAIQEMDEHEQAPMQGSQAQQRVIRMFESEDKESYIMEIVIEQEGREEDEIVNVIEVMRPKYAKAYVGGFRNGRTGQEYHHGIAQTDQVRREHV